MFFLVIPLIIMTLFISCAQENESPQASKGLFDSATGGAPASPGYRDAEESVADDVDRSSDEFEARKAKRRGRNEKSENAANGLDSHFIIPFDFAQERLIEYTVNVTYETDNLLISRKRLLEIIGKYGFIKSSSASTETSNPTSNTEIQIKAEKLYDALRDLEEIGILKSELIRTNDHTENMILSGRKVRRENIRIIRRGRATRNVSTASKNWAQIENALQNSEDKLDAAEHQKWKIRDKVSWASVNIFLKGPESPNRVEVPLYRNAFIGLANFFLNLLYVIIWLVPFVLIFILFWLNRNRIISVFKRKK